MSALFNKYKRRASHIFEHRTLPSRKSVDPNEAKAKGWLAGCPTNQSDSPRRIRVYVFSMDLIYFICWTTVLITSACVAGPKMQRSLSRHNAEQHGKCNAIVEHDDFVEVEPNGLIPAVILKPSVLVKSCALCRFCVPTVIPTCVFNDKINVERLILIFGVTILRFQNEGELDV